MRVEAFSSLRRVIIVRDENYVKEFNGFVAARDFHVVAAAQQMEFALIASAGHPEGSSQAVLGLNEIPPSEWEQVLAFMEIREKGSARLSLELIEQQRIYKQDGVSIVYMIIRNETLTTLYLGALTVHEGMIPDILWKMLWSRP